MPENRRKLLILPWDFLKEYSSKSNNHLSSLASTLEELSDGIHLCDAAIMAGRRNFLDILLKGRMNAQIEEEIKKSPLIPYFLNDKCYPRLIISPYSTNQNYHDLIIRSKVLPERVYVLDQNLARGVARGNAIGAKTVWAKIGEYSGNPLNPKTIPTHTIGHPIELLDVI